MYFSMFHHSKRAHGFLGVALGLSLAATSLAAGTSLARADTQYCAGKPATIVGAAGDVVIYGAVDNDVIAGFGGDDKIWGLYGDDIILIYDYPGSNVLHCGPGIDRVSRDQYSTSCEYSHR